MKKNIFGIIVGFIPLLGLSLPAQAHFQIVYTPETARTLRW